MIDSTLLEIAAEWWIEQISGPKLNWDNGAQNEGSAEDRRMGNMMWMLGNSLALSSREKITPDKIATFKKSLIEEMEKELGESRRQDSLTLSVDYGPDHVLGEACRKAGIDGSAFPCKTVMWIDAKKVSAKCGYGASEKIVAEL